MSTPAAIKEQFLIVGQGIAGTMLAYFLWLKKQPYQVVDFRMEGSSSPIAAGIINPITGRRLVKSWRFDELSDFAKKTYQNFGQTFGVKVFEEKNILRALSNVFELNEWDRRSGFPENRNFFKGKADVGDFKDLLKPTYGWGELTGAGQVDFRLLLDTFKHFLEQKKSFQNEQFEFDQLELGNGGASYKGVPYRKIVFCEGARGKENPYFGYLPFAPSKGELILIKCNGWTPKKLVKNHIYIAPFEKDILWAGSTNSFDFDGPCPTNEKLQFLKTRLDEMLSAPFEIISHHAGIRPTVTDKRPFLGVHPHHKQLYIFSGLGTKGASLAPFFANQMANYLLEERALDKEVDIKRFAG